ncbi:MAG: malonyl-CoA synthase [Alphaproteobacteria bacterium]|jgi:malonyl-CoA/methylmalonyl-CoA synthetase|nr:malonyl-CoA synthase [Alphaproteobacteria bacterium]
MTNHLFDAIRAAMPAADATFLSTPGGLRLSYGDLLARSGRMANLLLQSGVKPGDRVAVQVEKSPDAILLYLACVRAGAIFLPLNTAYTLNEVEYFVGDAEPRLVICGADRVEAITAMGPQAETLAAFAARAAGQSAEFADVARGPDDLAAILYTSGTTGRSKGAMLSHRNLASNASTLVDSWRFTRSDVLLHALPIFHTHGLFVATNVILLSGASMIFLTRFDPAEILRLLPQTTVMMGVPTFYVRLLQDPGLDQAATANIRLFVSGSAPLLAETHEAWRQRTGHAILERYGMTETNMNTSNPYDGPRVAGTVGPPLPGVEVRVVDPESGRALPNGEIGMIEIRGPNVFQGYWRMPEKTAAEFRPDGFFISGDLGLIDAAGYVQISGRGKDLVISGGYNVYPKEVEGEIDALDGVVESAVIGLPHRDFGEGVTAVVVRKPGASLGEAEVLAALDGRLARYKQPKRVLFVDDLPRNTMGKVQKNVLREKYRDLYAG